MNSTSAMVTFDTNLLLYSADVRDLRKQRIAIQTVRNTQDAVLLWQPACEFIAASRKLAEHGLTTIEAWAILADFLRAFRLVVPTPTVLQRARILHLEQGWSFWDATLVGACLDAGITRLYSEDLPGRRPPEGLEIVNPFA